jgi:hypothetical protein
MEGFLKRGKQGKKEGRRSKVEVRSNTTTSSQPVTSQRVTGYWLTCLPARSLEEWLAEGLVVTSTYDLRPSTFLKRPGS